MWRGCFSKIKTRSRVEVVRQRKKRKKRYAVNWLKNMVRKRNIKVLYKKHRRKSGKPNKS